MSVEVTGRSCPVPAGSCQRPPGHVQGSWWDGRVPPETPAYRLVRPAPRPVVVPELDEAQQAVVDHRGGPLLVLAGPGTGKTTTVVEAVAARIDEGLDPEQVLVLTFGRRAAAELRARVTARLGRATKEPLARTFHSYAFGLLRREAALRGEPAPAAAVRSRAGPGRPRPAGRRPRGRRARLAGAAARGAADPRVRPGAARPGHAGLRARRHRRPSSSGSAGGRGATTGARRPASCGSTPG